MFSRKCVCKLNISKIVRPLLAAVGVNGLTHPGLSIFHNKYPDNFDDIILMRAFIGNYLKGICLSEHHQQVSFKYFINSCFFPM